MAKFLNPSEPVATAPPNILLELDPYDVQGLLSLVWEKRQKVPSENTRATRFYDQLDRALTAANIAQTTARMGGA